jgi:anti-sigma factor RsiW
MPHGLSEEKWIEYLEGGLPPPEAARLKAHAAGCPECGEMLRGLSVWRQNLVVEAARIREAFETSPEDLDRLLAASLGRIRETRNPWTFREAVTLLRLLLEPFCGSGTAGAAVHLAVRKSTAEGSDENSADWNCFVSNMSEMMSSVCGTEAGRLIHQVGVSLHVA